MTRSQETLRKYEQAKNAYDKVLDEMNRLSYEYDLPGSAEKKQELKKKMDATREKLKEADRKEKEAKRAYDATA